MYVKLLVQWLIHRRCLKNGQSSYLSLHINILATHWQNVAYCPIFMMPNLHMGGIHFILFFYDFSNTKFIMTMMMINSNYFDL